MRLVLHLAAASLASLGLASGTATADENIALRGGETADLGPLYWASNCRSLLTSIPVAEVMEGPAELSISVKSQKVLPRKNNCAKPIDGGELFLSAKTDIPARVQGKLFVRIKYPTKDGERQGSREISYTLFPVK